jgi:glycosyltransferase involved in cell wall biosynthesis
VPEIVIVIEGLGGGGAQRVATALADRWARDGRGVAVVTLAGAETDFFTLNSKVKRRVAGGIDVSKNLVAGLIANLRRVMALRKILREECPRVVVGFGAPINIVVILAAKFLGARVVISERNDPARQSFGRVWDALRRALYRFADVVTANSGAAIEAMRSYVPPEKLVLLPNPPPEPPGREPTPGPVVLAVGRLHPQKAHDVLISAFARISPKFPCWSLVIIGEGDLREDLERQTAELGLAGRVRLPGQTGDPYHYYLSAGIFALPSRYEGSSNALQEAMACGLPVIVSDACPGSIDLVEDCKSGLVVRAGDVDSLASALARLIEAEDFRARLGAAGRDSISRFRDLNAFAEWERTLFGEKFQKGPTPEGGVS